MYVFANTAEYFMLCFFINTKTCRNHIEVRSYLSMMWRTQTGGLRAEGSSLGRTS